MKSRRDVLSVSMSAGVTAIVLGAADKALAKSGPDAPLGVKVFDAVAEDATGQYTGKGLAESVIDYYVDCECETGIPLTDIYFTKACYKQAIRNNMIDYPVGPGHDYPGYLLKPMFLGRNVHIPGTKLA